MTPVEMTYETDGDFCPHKQNPPFRKRERMGHPAVVGGLVADGEALVEVLRLFDLVCGGYGVVLHGDGTVAVRAYDEVIFAEAELAGAFAGLEETCGCEVGSVDRIVLQQRFVHLDVRGGDW